MEDREQGMVVQEEEEDDDEFVPHPHDAGKGRCREYHFRDEVTDVECVRVVTHGEVDGPGHESYYEEVRALVAGEGISIGKNPCEFHRNLAEWGWI